MDKDLLINGVNLRKSEILERYNAANPNTLMETLGIRFTDVGEDFLEGQMDVSPMVHQPMGILHGGATAALAETVGSAASLMFVDHKEKVVKGIELSINHLKSVREGRVKAIAKIQHQGRTVHLWEIRVYDESDKLVAISKLSNIVLDKKK